MNSPKNFLSRLFLQLSFFIRRITVPNKHNVTQYNFLRNPKVFFIFSIVFSYRSFSNDCGATDLHLNHPRNKNLITNSFFVIVKITTFIYKNNFKLLTCNIIFFINIIQGFLEVLLGHHHS